MCSWHKSCDIEKFNRDRPSSVNTRPIIRFTSISEIVSFACTVDLKVSDGSLRVDGRETIDLFSQWSIVKMLCLLTGSCLDSCELEFNRRGVLHGPTLELASVKEFRVVLLPLDGLPTSPIKGSRGILRSGQRILASCAW